MTDDVKPLTDEEIAGALTARLAEVERERDEAVAANREHLPTAGMRAQAGAAFLFLRERDEAVAALATERRARAEVEAVLERVREAVYGPVRPGFAGNPYAPGVRFERVRAALDDTPRPTALREFAIKVAEEAFAYVEGETERKARPRAAHAVVSRLLPDKTEGKAGKSKSFGGVSALPDALVSSRRRAAGEEGENPSEQESRESGGDD